MDRILLQGLAFYGHHGATPQERETGGRFLVDLEVEADLSLPARSDRLEDTINYSLLYRLVREVVEGPPRHLLEALAGQIAGLVLERFPRASRVRVRVAKPAPPVAGMATGLVAVEVERDRATGRPGR